MSKRSYTQLQALAEIFKVLGDTTRVRILDALTQAEVPVCDLAELLDLTQSAVSHQLRLLRGARLVKSRRAGQHIYYTLDDHHIVKLFEQGFEHVQQRDSAQRGRRGVRTPAPSASCTRSRLSRSKAWTAAKRWRFSSAASRIWSAW